MSIQEQGLDIGMRPDQVIITPGMKDHLSQKGLIFTNTDLESAEIKALVLMTEREEPFVVQDGLLVPVEPDAYRLTRANFAWLAERGEGYYASTDLPHLKANFLASITGIRHAVHFDGTVVRLEPKDDRERDLLSLWNRASEVVRGRVEFNGAHRVQPGCYDVFIDEERVGGIAGITDSESLKLRSNITKVQILNLHDAVLGSSEDGGFDDTMLRVIGDTLDHPYSLHGRQRIFLSQIAQNREFGQRVFLDQLNLASELGTALEKDGIPVKGIFLVGEAAYLMNIGQEIPFLFSRTIFQDRAIPAKPLDSSMLARYLYDVDLTLWVDDPTKIDWSKYVGRSWGKGVYLPFGYHTEEVIKDFPGKIGLDICAFPNQAFLTALQALEPSNPHFHRTDLGLLIRYPYPSKWSESLLAADLLLQAVPVWWNKQYSTEYHLLRRAILDFYSNVPLNDFLARFLSTQQEGDYYRAILADEAVRKILEQRWNSGNLPSFVQL